MTIEHFKKIQKRNYAAGIIGAIFCIWGLTNASYNKGVVDGASTVLTKKNAESYDDKNN